MSGTSALAHKYDYRRRLPHYQKADRAIFVTFRKLVRNPFTAGARDLILQHCRHDDGKRYVIHAAVVIPDHVAHVADSHVRPRGLASFFAGNLEADQGSFGSERK